jgi:biotin-dependent carboxylase-like uncharacterized protein
MMTVLAPGFNNSVQDLGRFGYAEFGVPNSGAMDLYSAKLANTILANNVTDSVIEITLGKCKLIFDKQTVICLTGSNLSACINNKRIDLNKIIDVRPMDVLSFEKPVYGTRCYLAIKGGFKSEKVLGSRSFYKGVTRSVFLSKNDTIPYNEYQLKKSESLSAVKIIKDHFSSKFIEAFKGPEFELLNEKQKNYLESQIFTISKDNSRMGYRLKELLKNEMDSMLTSAVLTGSVQLTPSGKIIILMRDCQVTGGYPRILQLTDNSIDKLAQKTTGDTFKFNIQSLK